MITIDITTPIKELHNYMSSKTWLEPEEKILALEKPGEGNMNIVLRVITNQRSFILKQSRPYVQKYQQIAAPLDRIAVEHQFYQAIQNNAINAYIPDIHRYDPENYIMLMEDLGRCEDMTSLYAARTIPAETLGALISIISIIHQTAAPDDFPENEELRQLNHQHIFVLPFMEDNGFQLDDVQPGLQELSLPYKNDIALKKKVEAIGTKYLSPGNTLLHGDYYPGSWMMVQDRVYVIDPEFSFVGFEEFDLGVMAGHLVLATMDGNYLTTVLKNYKGNADTSLVSQVAGIEIIRRLIGLAQLPLERTIQEKDYLLQMARKMILA